MEDDGNEGREGRERGTGTGEHVEGIQDALRQKQRSEGVWREEEEGKC